MNNKQKEKILRSMLNNKDIMKQLELAYKLDKNVKISNLIFETEEHDKIGMLKGNRTLDLNNLKKIKKSIVDNGYKKSQPITLDKDLCIMDGQHRKKSCEELNISMPFVIELENDNSLKLTQQLNSNQKNWKITDFINSYADRDFKDYKLFKKFVKEEEISESLLLWLLYHSRNGEIQNRVKEGKLVCTELQLATAKEVLKKAREIRAALPSQTPQYKNFMKDKVLIPLTSIMEEEKYSHDRMIKQMREEYYNLQLDSMVNVGTSLVNIYNKKLGAKNRLPEYK